MLIYTLLVIALSLIVGFILGFWFAIRKVIERPEVADLQKERDQLRWELDCLQVKFP